MILPAVLFLLLASPGHSWSVLISNTFATTSHQTVSGYLANLLAENGHHVTYLSTNLPSNLHEAVVALPLPTTEERGNEPIRASSKGKVGGGKYTWGEVFGLLDTFFGLCGDFFEEPAVQQLMTTNTKKFDLFITFALFDTCGLGLAHHLGIPNTVIHSPGPIIFPYQITYLGLPIYASSHKVDVLTLADPTELRASGVARFKQVLKSNLLSAFQSFYTSRWIEPAIRKHVPGYPGAKEVYDSVKMMFIHSHPHPLIDQPQPVGPGVVNLGGSLCSTYQPDRLGEDLLKFLDDSEGFIVISFGSLTDSMSVEEEQLWIEAFASFPYRVVWKLKTVQSTLPDSIMSLPWLPQKDLIQHPKIKLFITHGGVASKLESFCAGVPMIFVPRFAADQFYNAKHYTEIGIAESVYVELGKTTATEIAGKIRVAIEEHSGKMGAISRQMLASKVSDEQVLGYVDMAVSGHKLLPGYQPWYQYLYLDIILLPLFTIYLVREAVWRIRGTAN